MLEISPKKALCWVCFIKVEIYLFEHNEWLQIEGKNWLQPATQNSFNIFATYFSKFFVKFPPGMTRVGTCSYLLMSCVLMDPGSSRMQLRLFPWNRCKRFLRCKIFKVLLFVYFHIFLVVLGQGQRCWFAFWLFFPCFHFFIDPFLFLHSLWSLKLHIKLSLEDLKLVFCWCKHWMRVVLYLWQLLFNYLFFPFRVTNFLTNIFVLLSMVFLYD